MMKLRFSWLVISLVIFVPFEVIILKYLPVSDTIYSILRFAVEFGIYFLAGLVLFRFLQLKKLPRGTPIDRPLIIFVLYAIIVTAINHAPFLQAVMGLRTLLRYVPLFYVLALINIDSLNAKRILQSIMFIAVLQSGLAIYQHYFGIAQFWYPRASDLEIGGKQVGFRLLTSGFSGGREMGAGIGTLGDSVFLALFLVISFLLGISSIQHKSGLKRNDKLMYGSAAAIIILALFFTYSRGSVLISFASIPLIIFFSGGRKRLVLYLTIFLLIISPFVILDMFGPPSGTPSYINPKMKYTDPFSNITTVFSSSYVDNTMQYSRGAVLTEIGGNLLKSFKLFGYSPAQEFALEKAATQLFGSNMPINNLPIINDVYWVAFIIYYGIIGIVIFYFLLYKLFITSLFVARNSPDPYFRIIAVAFAALVVISIPYTLILRTFLFRSFGFYFWLLGGLVFSEWRKLKNNKVAFG